MLASPQSDLELSGSDSSRCRRPPSVFHRWTSHNASGWREINRENKPALTWRRPHRRPYLKEILEIVGSRNDSSDRGPSLFSATFIFTRTQGGLKMQSSSKLLMRCELGLARMWRGHVAFCLLFCAATVFYSFFFFLTTAKTRFSATTFTVKYKMCPASFAIFAETLNCLISLNSS